MSTASTYQPPPRYASAALTLSPPRWMLTSSNEYMKVQLAKLKADQEKTGKKADHKVRPC